MKTSKIMKMAVTVTLLILSFNLFAGLVPSGKISGAINSSVVDSKGQLWVLTSGSYDAKDNFVPGRLLKYNQETSKFEATPELLAEEAGWHGSLVVDKNDNLWMTAGYAGTVACRFDGKEWKTFDLQGGQTTITLDYRGENVFFVTSSSFVSVNVETLETKKIIFKEFHN